jgi:hypothetical protein
MEDNMNEQLITESLTHESSLKNRNYKYPEGYKEHYKNINKIKDYNKTYYLKTVNYINCEKCGTTLNNRFLKAHKMTKRCKKLEVLKNNILELNSA